MTATQDVCDFILWVGIPTIIIAFGFYFKYHQLFRNVNGWLLVIFVLSLFFSAMIYGLKIEPEDWKGGEELGDFLLALMMSYCTAFIFWVIIDLRAEFKKENEQFDRIREFIIPIVSEVNSMMLKFDGHTDHRPWSYTDTIKTTKQRHYEIMDAYGQRIHQAGEPSRTELCFLLTQRCKNLHDLASKQNDGIRNHLRDMPKAFTEYFQKIDYILKKHTSDAEIGAMFPLPHHSDLFRNVHHRMLELQENVYLPMRKMHHISPTDLTRNEAYLQGIDPPNSSFL